MRRKIYLGIALWSQRRDDIYELNLDTLNIERSWRIPSIGVPIIGTFRGQSITYKKKPYFVLFGVRYNSNLRNTYSHFIHRFDPKDSSLIESVPPLTVDNLRTFDKDEILNGAINTYIYSYDGKYYFKSSLLATLGTRIFCPNVGEQYKKSSDFPFIDTTQSGYRTGEYQIAGKPAIDEENGIMYVPMRYPHNPTTKGAIIGYDLKTHTPFRFRDFLYGAYNAQYDPKNKLLYAGCVPNKTVVVLDASSDSLSIVNTIDLTVNFPFIDPDEYLKPVYTGINKKTGDYIAIDTWYGELDQTSGFALIRNGDLVVNHFNFFRPYLVDWESAFPYRDIVIDEERNHIFTRGQILDKDGKAKEYSFRVWEIVGSELKLKKIFLGIPHAYRIYSHPIEIVDEPPDDDEREKITICHIPPGNPENPQTIRIPISALKAHLAHGDYIGPCETGDKNKRERLNRRLRERRMRG